jgi:hypothetical protein
MSKVPLEPPADFDRLLEDLCNKRIDDAGRSRLAGILLTNDEACQKYVEMVYLCVGISYLTGVKTQAAHIGQPDLSNSAWPLPARESCSGSLPATGLSTFASSTSKLFDSWVGSRKLAIAAALVICAALGFLASRWTDDSGKETAQEAARDSAARSMAFDARTLRIDSGSARITLPQVGYMLIDGPAEVDLVSPLRAILNRGRIRVRVTEASGRGFVVETPDGNVTDLSTEFGLEVVEGKKTGVVVFDGEVDLQVKQGETAGAAKAQRLVEGEAVAFNKQGELDRISSITTGRVATFEADDTATDAASAIITKVSDNLRTSDTKKFYEIVPGGLNEDMRSYVDRPLHEWNGVTSSGMPKYLIGADYVKTFNEDKTRGNMKIDVSVSQPANLYVIFDERLPVPDWLKKGFKKTGDRLALDLGPFKNNNNYLVADGAIIGVGPGNDLDHFFTIWKRTVKQPGVVKLGPNLLSRRGLETGAAMYGIAAVAIESKGEKVASQQNSAEQGVVQESARQN